MATTFNYTFSLHPSSPSLPFSIKTGSSTDAKVFYFIPDKYIKTLLTFSVPAYMQNSTSGVTQYRWNNTCNYDTGTTVRSGTNGSTVSNNLKNDFNNINGAKQVLCVRVQFDHANTNYTVNSTTFTGTCYVPESSSEVGYIEKVKAGDTITRADMVTLQKYIDDLYAAQGLSSNISIVNPNAGTSILPSNFQNYINKANALPYVSNLTLPAQNTSITANYYNAIVDALRP